MTVTRIAQLADDERTRMNEWADRWIDIGLRTGPADRERFEAAVRDCYRYAGIPFPGVVVWVPSPMTLALAAPAAAFNIELIEAVERRQPMDRDAVHDAVNGVVNGAVSGAVHGAVNGAVSGAVSGAMGGAVNGAVDDAVRDAVLSAVRGANLRSAVLSAIDRGWPRYLGGQFWVGGWGYWGAAYTSFFREVCKLELKDDLWDRGRAYEATAESACWWWPHRRFVMVSERPLEIHRELVDPGRDRGWGSHRLHRDEGPAVVWPDGWGVYSVHGVRVPRQVVEAPETLTVAQITGEENAEVRRIMIERFGAGRYMRDASGKLVDEDAEWGKLWRVEQDDDEPLMMVEVVNSTPEPDGSFKDYWLRVPPTVGSAHEAVAWTFGMVPDEYDETVAS